MAGAVSRDSLARCEQPSMLYDAIRYPHAPSVPSKPNATLADPAKDTIESTQQRLNREMTEKFQNTSSRLSHHSYVAVAQTGKYLFLAIMLPPYLCCYGIPKWLLLNLLPQVFTSVQVQVLRVGRFFGELSARVADLMKGILEQMLGDALRAARRQAKAFADFFKSWRRKQAGRFARLKKQGIAFGVRLHQAIFAYPKRGYALCKSWLAESARRMFGKIAQMLAAVLRFVLFPLDLVDRLVWTPLGRRLKARLCLVFAMLKRQVRKVAAAAARMQQRLKRWCQPVVDFCAWLGGCAHAMSTQLSCIFQRHWKVVQPGTVAKLSIVYGLARSGVQRLYRVVEPPVKRVLRALPRALVASARCIGRRGSLLAGQCQRVCMRAGRAVWRMMPGKAAKCPSKWPGRFHMWAKACGRALQMVGALCRWMKQRFLSFWAALRDMGALLVQLVVALPASAVQAGVRLFWLCVRAFRHGIYGMRLLLAWSVAFGRLGMGLVRELSSEIGSWLLRH